ncbi:hypothetical protein EV188_104405 [Actinomycetospora succinea]|uniref:CYTH domain-containing protein n=1 Tax=Actinomycetospora succinea TaxID=663603 RepID=A0A4R6VDW8_9PSEU|nr:hypothetical protein [Actinomycetospora succinea]TDQ58658.1 hypothetical protein EV188_104405 [Actinomycetospora succinea]
MLEWSDVSSGTDLAAALGFPPPEDVAWARVVDGDAESVELKVLLTPRPGSTVHLVGRHGRVRTRRLHLLDTPDLGLAHRGVHVRLRDRGRGRWDLTVRVRGEDPVPGGAPPAASRIELDMLPGLVHRSTEIRAALDVERALDVRDERVPVQKVLTDDQEALLQGAAGDLGSEELGVFGPLVIERASVPRSLCGIAHARHERFRFPGGRVLEEFSARCAPADACRTAEDVAVFLATHGLVPAPPHRSKTTMWTEQLRRAPRR